MHLQECCLGGRMDNRPRPLARTLPADLSVPERILLFSVASSTEWERAGITGATVTAMIVRGLIERDAGKEQPTTPQSSGVQVPVPPIACRRAVSISDARGVTNRVLLGRKSPGCPAGVFAAVGTIWGASGGEQTWRPEHNEISATSKVPPHEVVSSGIAAGSRPTFPLGKADDIVEETGESTRCTAGVGDPASKNRLLEITSGSCRGQQGLVTTVTTCKDSPNEAKSRRRREPNGSGG